MSATKKKKATKTPGVKKNAPAAALARAKSKLVKLDSPTGGRAIPEWSSDNPDAKVPPNVRLRIWRRQNGMCAITGLKLGPPVKGEAALDHIKPLVEGGKHAESNLRWIGAEPHKEKTKGEVKRKSKADRVALRATGIRESKTPLQSKGFDPAAKQLKASRPIEKKAPKTFVDPFAGLPRRVCGVTV